MLRAWTVTVAHAVLCIVMVVGVLYAHTPIAQGAITATLMLLFVGVRMFGTCIMDPYEAHPNKPILAEMGRQMSIKDPDEVSRYNFEQIVIGNLLVIQMVKIYAPSIAPLDKLFETQNH